jgi:hypothetical protein
MHWRVACPQCVSQSAPAANGRPDFAISGHFFAPSERVDGGAAAVHACLRGAERMRA